MKNIYIYTLAKKSEILPEQRFVGWLENGRMIKNGRICRMVEKGS